MAKYTKTTLNKIEAIFEALDYTVRYAKGNFNSGYALVEDRKIVVINKFFDTQGRAETLLDILRGLEVDPEQFDEADAKNYRKYVPVEDA